MPSAQIITLCEENRIALDLLLRIKAAVDKGHPSVTTGMPRFLTLERQCSCLRSETDPSAHIRRGYPLSPFSFSKCDTNFVY